MLQVGQVLRLAHPVEEHVGGGALLIGGVGVDAHDHAVAGVLIVVSGVAVGHGAGNGGAQNSDLSVGVVSLQAVEHIGAVGHVEAVGGTLAGDKLALGEGVIGGQVELGVDQALVVLGVGIL